MATYKLKHTDPSNGKISIFDDETDGYSSPSSSNVYIHPSTGLPACGHNSPLVFIGRSLLDYGEVIQNNLLYLLENFANPTRPQSPSQGQLWYKNTDMLDESFPEDPTQAGLYVWTGEVWTAIPLASGAAADLNMGNFKVTNMADPTQPMDAVNLRTADGRYLRLTGGTVTGLATFSGGAQVPSGSALSLADLPLLGTSATNKTYVDDADQQLLAMINDISGNVITDLSRYVRKVGDTMTGTLELDSSAGLNIKAGTGVITMGSRRIQNLGEPTNNSDATTRFYVDRAISEAISTAPAPIVPEDIYVNGGSVSGETGLITLVRSAGAAPVVLTGTVAMKNHTHSGNSLTIETKTNYPLSTIASMVADNQLEQPEDTISNVVRVLDQAITDVSRPRHRRVFTQTGTNVLYTLPLHMEYQVDQCALDVYVNGVKYVANERGLGSIRFSNPVLLMSPICTDGTFVLNVKVNGTSYPLSITAASMSLMTFVEAIILALEAGNVPATVQLDQTMSGIYVYIKSLTTGAGSSVDLSGAISVLQSKFDSFDQAESYTVTQTMGYVEIGDPGDDSTQIQFTEVLPVGSVIEVIAS